MLDQKGKGKKNGNIVREFLSLVGIRRGADVRARLREPLGIPSGQRKMLIYLGTERTDLDSRTREKRKEEKQKRKLLPTKTLPPLPVKPVHNDRNPSRVRILMHDSIHIFRLSSVCVRTYCIIMCPVCVCVCVSVCKRVSTFLPSSFPVVSHFRPFSSFCSESVYARTQRKRKKHEETERLIYHSITYAKLV